jgi:predicted glycosyltransferase
MQKHEMIGCIFRRARGTVRLQQMLTRPAILFYCQHSLGMGHLLRSLALAESLAKRFQVMLLNGGRLPKRLTPPKNVALVNLPPLGLDESNELVSHDKRITVERALRRREKMIEVCFDNLRPAVLFVELFPFGRRKFTRELLPLLQAARMDHTRALVVCSLRDILVNGRDKQQQYYDRAAGLANEFFDLILVHSDPSFGRFEESFHSSVPLQVPVIHTGFVAPPFLPCTRAHGDRKRIVVSAGGGLFGDGLLRTAIESYDHLETDPQIEMKVIAGPFLPDESWEALQTLAHGKERLRLVRQVADLCSELKGAAASISQAGYNTCLDVVRAGVPALLVPFAKKNGDEQQRRALRLREMGAVKVLDERDVTPAQLAAQVRELMSFNFTRPMLDLNGAENTVQLIESLLATTMPIAAFAYETSYEN